MNSGPNDRGLEFVKVASDNLQKGKQYVYFFMEEGKSTKGPVEFISVDNNMITLKSLTGPSEYIVDKTKTQFSRRTPLPMWANMPTGELETREIPHGSETALEGEEILDGNIMVNFHGESKLNEPRYYKRKNYNRMTIRVNPYTKRRIEPTDVTTYRANVESYKAAYLRKSREPRQGGKRRKTSKHKPKRKSRKYSRRQ